LPPQRLFAFAKDLLEFRALCTRIFWNFFNSIFVMVGCAFRQVTLATCMLRSIVRAKPRFLNKENKNANGPPRAPK
jgi:hypothetical protein